MSRSPEQNVVGGGTSNAAKGGGMCPVRHVSGGGVPNLAYQALFREMSRFLQQQLEPIQEHLDQLEERTQRERTPLNPRRERGRLWQHDDDLYEPSDVESGQASNQSERRPGQRN